MNLITPLCKVVRSPFSRRWALAAGLVWLSPAALADTPGVTSQLTVHRVVAQANGEEALQPARLIQPGDVLQYLAVFRNPGPTALGRLQASLPIPAGTELLTGSAVPRGAMASLDGKVYQALPLMRKIQRADGQWADVAVPPAEIRSLRWPEQTLAAGASFSATARVRVSTVAPPAALAVAGAASALPSATAASPAPR